MSVHSKERQDGDDDNDQADEIDQSVHGNLPEITSCDAVSTQPNPGLFPVAAHNGGGRWEHDARRMRAWCARSSAAIAAAIVIGALLNFSPLDPIKALFWSAVINGVVAVPVMVMIMRLATSKETMGRFRISRTLKVFGWLATLTMLFAVGGMFLTWSA
jgi:hypothetical protein